MVICQNGKLRISISIYVTICRRQILLKEFSIKRARNECPVITLVPSYWTKEQHERIAQIFFESFNIPGLYIADQALMSLYGCNSMNGLVIDIGHGTTGT